MRFVFFTLLMGHQHRHGHRVQDALRRATQDELAHARATIGAHDDQVGVKATAAHDVAPGIEIGERILSRAADIDADLIVMGAYGRSRVRELVLGGATKGILEAMTVPVLMAH